MALLPLAGFAASTVEISTANVTITLQQSTPVYNNEVQTPTITKVVVDGVEYTSELTQFFTPKYYKKNTAGNWIAQNADQIQDGNSSCSCSEQLDGRSCIFSNRYSCVDYLVFGIIDLDLGIIKQLLTISDEDLGLLHKLDRVFCHHSHNHNKSYKDEDETDH